MEADIDYSKLLSCMFEAFSVSSMIKENRKQCSFSHI